MRKGYCLSLGQVVKKNDIHRLDDCKSRRDKLITRIAWEIKGMHHEGNRITRINFLQTHPVYYTLVMDQLKRIK